jgi:hypothetical protein
MLGDADTDSDSGFVRHSLDALARLRRGWPPDRRVLANARYAEHWLVIRRDETTGYQFIGFPPGVAGTNVHVHRNRACDRSDSGLGAVGRWQVDQDRQGAADIGSVRSG